MPDLRRLLALGAVLAIAGAMVAPATTGAGSPPPPVASWATGTRQAGSAGGRVPPQRPPVALARVLRDGLASLAVAPADSSGRQYAGLRRGAAPGEVAVAIGIATGSRSVALAAARAAGARIANTDASGVEAYVPARSLVALASIPGIVAVDPIRRLVPAAALSAAVALHGADAWHVAGFVGNGARVGIIDGGFSGIASLLGADLPASVHARCYTAVGVYTSSVSACEQGGVTHGTAVAESLAAMAPGASLWIANPTSQDDLTSTVDWMTGNGVRIINASWTVVGFEGPGDGTSPYASSSYSLVDRAVAAGALWVNAAGNAGEDGWVGPWRDGGNGWLAFSGTDTSDHVTLQQGDEVSVSLRWSDPWGRAADDLDLALYAQGSDTPVASSSNVQDGTGDPVESLTYDVPTAGDYYVAVHRRSGGAPARIQLLVQSETESPLTYHTSDDTLASPADGRNPGMLTVGAVDVTAPSTVEAYSSRGPTLDGRTKPDLVAADCADTSSIAAFCGTSQSTPLVAGAAADLLGANPTWSTARVVQVLTGRAVAIGTPIPSDAAGYGRLALGDPPSIPAALRFVDEPIGGVAGAAMPVQPTVEIVNASGERVTSGAGSSLAVTLGLTGAPAAGLACAGPLSQTAVRGLAAFSGCAISAAAPSVRLTASAGALPDAASSVFDVVGSDAPRSTLSLAAGSSVITWGSAAAFSVRAIRDAGTPIVGGAVDMEVSTDGVGWTDAGTMATDADGIGRFAYRPATNLWYRAVMRPAGGLAPAVSGRGRVVVRQLALLRPTGGGSIRSVGRGTVVVFSTTVRPSRPELAPPTVTYAIYRLAGGRWILAAQVRARANALGLAALTWRFATPGSWEVRSMADPTPLNANSTWTTFERYLVR